MAVEYNRLYFLIDWLIHPNRFFTQFSKSFAQLSGVKKTLVFLLSYLIPIACGLEWYWIWSQFAIYIISDRIVPTEIVFVILIGTIFIINFILLTYFQQGFKKDINERLQASDSVERFAETKEEPGMRMLSRLYVTRNNLFFIPMAIVFLSMGLTNITRTWNIYNLGLYLTITVWIMLLWMGYFAFSSLYSIGAEFPDLNCPKVTIKRLLWRAALSLTLYAVFVISLTVVLNAWLGAEEMPLWYKIAMFLLHGN
jgi:hypothetical protein